MQNILWLSEISLSDIARVGGKTASLGEMVQALAPKGIHLPTGFAITADAYWEHLEKNHLKEKLSELLTNLDIENTQELAERAEAARRLVLSAPLPESVACEILLAYRKLGEKLGEPSPDVAVRSSATAEDLPEASFAGQQETYLNIRGETALLEACRKCLASLFTERAISYRQKLGFDHLGIALSICVQKMVRSDLAASGVMFTIDTETGFSEIVLINGAYGLGETIVQGAVNPDEYFVFKPTLREGKRPILRKELGGKETKLVYETGGDASTKNMPVPAEERARFVLTEDEILKLANWGLTIEEHYSTLHGRPTPMDIEWAKDGLTGEMYVVQARPETVQSRKVGNEITQYSLLETPEPIVAGHSVGSKIAQGKVRVVRSAAERHLFRDGEVLVAENTDPDWEPIMKRAAAIVTDRGGRTCHAAIISRELGIPAVVGTGNATKVLKDGEEVTVSCSQGTAGFVYAGRIPFRVENLDMGKLAKPKTQIMLNVANPANALALSFLPQDGVGLAREEFIIADHLRVHPLALIHFDQLKDESVKREIMEITAGYQDRKQYFIDRLAEGVAMIAAAFYPKDVIVRLSDFKSNEYAHLIGGAEFEPKEENPMIGFRGASRYYHPFYQEAFSLECRALQKVRSEMGLTNLKVMVPFCRTPEEGRKVISEMEKCGLVQGENGLEVYVMCEIPSNVILAEEFAEIFDGFSIGSNDLTQLILGLDRDSSQLTELFDERNPAVLAMISQVIAAAKAAGKKIGICGQAPSDYPEFAAFLVKEGIDSISLNPDSVLKTTRVVLAEEARRHAHGSGKLKKASGGYDWMA